VGVVYLWKNGHGHTHHPDKGSNYTFGDLLRKVNDCLIRDLNPEYMTYLHQWYSRETGKRIPGLYATEGADLVLQTHNIDGKGNFGYMAELTFTDTDAARELLLRVLEGSVFPDRPFNGPQVERPTFWPLLDRVWSEVAKLAAIRMKAPYWFIRAKDKARWLVARMKRA
jgi:hypothetical protein